MSRITRTSARERVFDVSRPVLGADVAVGVVAVAIGLVLVPLLGAAFGPSLITFTACAVAVAVVGLLPVRAAGYVVPALLVVGLVVLITLEADGILVLSLVAGAMLGVNVMRRLIWLGQERVRPPEERPERPETPAHPGLPRMLHDDGDDDVRVDGPSGAEVVAAVRALDGVQRTTVSVVRDFARVDVAGDASTTGAPFVVYACPDLRPTRPAWRTLTTPGASAEPRGEQLEVVVARTPGHFPPFETTTLDAALRAIVALVDTGAIDETLPWSGDHSTDELRPTSLQQTDRD